jgi:hypothetical protein
MEFARLVEHCIEGVFVLFAPLTTAGSPRASLVNCHPLQASRALSEHLLVIEPQVDVQSWLARTVASRRADLGSWLGHWSQELAMLAIAA